MTAPTEHTRWIGPRSVDVNGWKLAERDTRAAANQFQSPSVNWSGIEIWRRVEGGYVAFQVRYRKNKPDTYQKNGKTLREVIGKLAADFYRNFDCDYPRFWADAFLEAALRDKELDKELEESWVI